jgi:hypothetical protein
MNQVKNFWELPVVNVIIGSFVGSLLTTLSSYVINNLKFKKESKINKDNAIKRAYYKLIGLFYKFYQLDYKRLEANIMNRYYAQLIVINKVGTNSVEAKEGARFDLKSEELIKEIILCKQELYEVYGALEILFSNNNKISGYIESIIELTPLEIKVHPNDKFKLVELDKWKTDALKDVVSTIDSGYKIKFNLLISEISEEINKQNV